MTALYGRIINDLVKEFMLEGGYSDAAEINTGGCESFAQALMRRTEIGDMYGVENFQHPDGTFDWTLLARWGITPPIGFTPSEVDAKRLGGHLWVEQGGRHYDSECPDGVSSFFDLPFFKRQLERK